MRQGVLIGALAILLGLVVWVAFYWQPGNWPASGASHQALPLAHPPRGGDFTLRSRDGAVRLADHRGQVVLLYFGYTWCPDICPTTLMSVAQAMKRLEPEELAQVEAWFVSVDPERDTPERLAEYVSWFHPKLRGLTGLPLEIVRVADQYGAAFRRVEIEQSAMGYLVDHSASTYLIDRTGQLAHTFDHGVPSETLLAALRELLDPAAD